MQYGALAKEFGDMKLPLEVLPSREGFYLGTQFEGGPYSRESLEYWPTPDLAAQAMANGQWNQLDHP